MSEWTKAPIGELADIFSGGTPSRTSPSYWNGNIPWVTPSDITACKTNYLYDTQDSITQTGLAACSATLLPTGAVLLTSRATIGEVRIAARPVATNQGFKSLIARRINAKFLFYQCFRQAQDFRRYAAGSTFLEINRKDTARIGIPYPVSPDVQEKIARILQTSDEAIEKTEALIEKYQRIKAGLMHDLFTRGIGPDGKLRPPREQAPELYQETAIGWIPKKWSVESLRQVCSSIVDCPHSTPTFLSSGKLVVRTMHIRHGVFLEGIASRVSEDEFNRRNLRAVPQAGDVVFTREAPVGEAFVVPDGLEICLGQRVMLFRPVSCKLNSVYLVAQIYGGSLRSRIKDLTAGTTNPHVNVADMTALSVALPPLEEQEIIAQQISGFSRMMASEETHKEKLISRKAGLMHDLLTGKVPVDPDPPEPADA